MRVITPIQVDNVEMGDVHGWDAFDFSDAYIVAADVDGVPMTEAEIEKFSDDYPDVVWEFAFESTH